MKIKVDEDEYKRLLYRVDSLEAQTRHDREYMLKYWCRTEEILYKMMEDYFKTKCMTVIVERDKKKIIAEVRKQAMDNLFKEV